MKTTSQLLWQLVHSLSNGEKLYFKRNYISSASAASALYIKLFDAIALQKEYNEPALLKKLHPFLSKKNIASQKHYLQQLICDAIIQYDGRNNIGQEIYNQLLLIRVYRKKGLLDEAHNLWKKAVKKARQNESFALLNLLKTEFEKMILLSSSHVKYDELHLLFKQNSISYPEYADLITLRDIYAETVLIKRKVHYDIDINQRENIKALLRRVDQYSNASGHHSFWLRHYYYMSKGSLMYMLGKIEEAFLLFKNIHEEWKTRNEFILSNGEHYVELLYMINYSGVICGKYDYLIEAFNHPVNNLVQDTTQKTNFQAIRFIAENRVYNRTAQYDKVAALLVYLKKNYQQWEPLLNNDINRTINLSAGIASFVLEEYMDALFFCKRAITIFTDGAREEHYAAAQMLLLLITYNINNARLFDAQYRTTYTYFHKRKIKHPFETALVQCLHRSFYITDNKSKIQEYKKAMKVFDDNKTDTVQQMASSIFNYYGWLQSKTQRISYRRYVEIKVKAKEISN